MEINMTELYWMQYLATFMQVFGVIVAVFLLVVLPLCLWFGHKFFEPVEISEETPTTIDGIVFAALNGDKNE